VENAAEVAEPDVGADALGQLEEGELLERDPNEAVDRVRQDRAEDSNDRQDQQIRDRAVGDSAPDERSPPRPPDGGLGGGSQRCGGPTAQLSRAG
jgi:hypothetical protein